MRVGRVSGVVRARWRPNAGMKTTRVVLSQLIFLYQLCRDIGSCWTWTGLGAIGLSSGIVAMTTIFDNVRKVEKSLRETDKPRLRHGGSQSLLIPRVLSNDNTCHKSYKSLSQT
jgi:hypothetical protein